LNAQLRATTSGLLAGLGVGDVLATL